MNERNDANKLRALMDTAEKKFTGLNKGSKILLKVSSFVFFAFLLVALILSVLFIANIVRFDGQAQMIQWIVLNSFRFWIVLVFGSIIMDIMIKR